MRRGARTNALGVSLALAAGGMVSLCLHLLRRLKAAEQRAAQALHLRDEERRGRTGAERALRRALRPANGEEVQHALQQIGTIRSIFPDRRGTPRQGPLVPDSRAIVVLDSAVISGDALDSLGEFSHCWLISCFHENTDAARRQTRVTKGNGGRRTFPAKTAPPRRGGKRVGVFSSRTPHRPNPLCLSLVRIVRVEAERSRVIVAGVDVIDGTPLFDIKPYVMYDAIPERHLVVPDWSRPQTYETMEVLITDEASRTINDSCGEGLLRFYSAGEAQAITRAVKQVASLDVRSLAQGRGKATEENDDYYFVIDSLRIHYRVADERGAPRVIIVGAAPAKG